MLELRCRMIGLEPREDTGLDGVRQGDLVASAEFAHRFCFALFANLFVASLFC